MIVIPAIDLKDGRCVRLRQGDMAAETVYGEDVPAMAKQWQQAGAALIHVVDLNGALEGEPRNLRHIEAVMQSVPVKLQIGGGIRTMATVRRYMQAGVYRIVLGTAALTNRSLLDEACREFPGRIVLGLDAREGRVAIQGWTALSDITAIELLKELAGCEIGAATFKALHHELVTIRRYSIIGVDESKILATSVIHANVACPS